MKVIFCSTIVESHNYKVFAIVDINNSLYLYPPTLILREMIFELQWMDIDEGFGLVLKIMKDRVIQPTKIENFDDLISKYPSCESTILPYLRDKKIDDLF